MLRSKSIIIDHFWIINLFSAQSIGSTFSKDFLLFFLSSSFNKVMEGKKKKIYSKLTQKLPGVNTSSIGLDWIELKMIWKLVRSCNCTIKSIIDIFHVGENSSEMSSKSFLFKYSRFHFWRKTLFSLALSNSNRSNKWFPKRFLKCSIFSFRLENVQFQLVFLCTSISVSRGYSTENWKY